MCEKLLLQTLDNVIQLDNVLEWIKSPNSKPDNEHIAHLNCTQIDFILFFLNYVHEISNRPPKTVQDAARNGEATTPKRRTSLLENLDLNDNVDAHVSPLYKQHPFARRAPSPKTPPNIRLGDFLIRKDPRKRVQKNLNETFGSRRINPISLSDGKTKTFSPNRNSFSFGKHDENLGTDRRNLLEERSRVAFDTGAETTITKVVSKKIGDEPDFNLVTFPQKLDILIDVYVFLLNNCYVANLTSEIYFIVSVLLKRDCGPRTSLQILNSLGNQVYFATGVLRKQTDFLRLLDRPTIRLLFDNARFRRFTNENFRLAFLKTYDGKVEKLVGVRQINKSVYFECDTDNRNNFATNASFHNFRKQRDLFYEVLRAWESNRMVNNWSFATALGQKVRYLVNLDSEPNNLIHFAKLFKAQLLVNACQDGTIGDEDTIKSAIPNIDEEKLSKLNTRIGKKNCTGINSIPTFTNYEEFYKDFVLIAASPSFSKHFVDVIAAEISRLNDDLSIGCSDRDEFDTFSETFRTGLITKVKTLRVLAKFLGFFESLPYRSSCVQLPENVVHDQLRIRNKIRLTLDLKKILLEASERRTLTVTIPWLVKYLAMLDSVTLKSNQIQDVFHILFKIHLDGSKYPMIVKLSVGWLLELPHVPHDLYYVWMSKNDAPMLLKPTTRTVQLDDLIGFDELLHVCCPYLGDIKSLLTADAIALDRSATCKHITPLTALGSVRETPKLQSQLEDMFFCTQPDSVKRTVEFVSERVASGCIKEICYEIVPSYKKEAMSKLRHEVDISSADIADKLQTYAGRSHANLLNVLGGKAEVILNLRISAAMEALLSSTVLQQTKDVCVFLTHRMCRKRVDEWVKSHVTQDIFINYFDNEIKKLKQQTKAKPQFGLPSLGKSDKHDGSTDSGMKIMELLRELCWRTVEGQPVTQVEIFSLLESIRTSFEGRCDINDCITLAINKLLLDFIILAIAHSPDSITTDVVTMCCVLYRACGNLDELVKTIFSPRNMFVLSMSSVPERSTNCFAVLIDALLQSELLTHAEILSQVLNCNANQALSKFLGEVLSRCKIKTED
ncbi:codanin-1 isoform X1 [Photinus pyralis]|uniref:codanin-1 isoform X1 n=1 Tax=Photinus pyralis TaxID=7054 RepID=UPI0012670E22|nr:codanin-1 isoform X1 [Photinus pyralis]XP_031331655.1 codanin-1 isoform X1 [Photinus pyralis]